MTREEFYAEIRDHALVRAGSTRITKLLPDGNVAEMSWLMDFRAIMLKPEWLSTYAELFWERFGDELPFQVGGIETAGVPLVTAIVMKSIERGTPINGFYVRKSRKREGLMKSVEGTLTRDPIILVDDLLNSGYSMLKQIQVLSAIGAHVKRAHVILAFREEFAYTEIARRGVDVSREYLLSDFGITLDPPQQTPRTYDVLWRHEAGDPSYEHVIHKSSPAIDDEHVYIGSDRGRFFALRKTDGSVAWTHTIGAHPRGKGIFSSPIVHDSMIYFGAYDGTVYALRTSDGAQLWHYDDADWVGSSPDLAADLGLVFIGLEFGLFRKHGGIVALDMRTGMRKWRDTTEALTHGSPLYIKKHTMVVIGSNDGIIYAYDARDGTRVWQYRTGGAIKMRPAHDEVHDAIICTSMDGGVYSVSLHGALRWRFEIGAPSYCTALIHQGIAYVTSLDKHIYAIDAARGTLVSKRPTRGRMFSSPAFGLGSVWAGSNDGCLYEWEPATLTYRGHVQVSERFVGMPAIDEQRGVIFAVTVANELYCIKRTHPNDLHGTSETSLSA